MNLKKSVYFINITTSIIPIIAITILTYFVYSNNIKKIEKEKLNIINQSIEKIIDKNIKYTVNYLVYLEKKYRIGKTRGEEEDGVEETEEEIKEEKINYMIEHMSSIYPKNGSIKFLAYGTEDKRIFFDDNAGNQNLPPDYDPRIRPWYKKALQGKDYYLSDVYNHQEKGYPMVTLSRKVMDEGKLQGVLTAVVDLTMLKDVLIEYKKMTQGGGFVILDSQNKMIINLSRGGENLKEILSKDFRNLQNNEYKKKINGKTIIYSSYKFKTLNLNLVSYISEANLNKELYRLRNITLAILVLALITISMILIKFGKLLDKSLKKLSNIIDDISNGNYPKNIDVLTKVIGENSELKMIKNSIKTMSEEVIRREKELTYISETDPLTNLYNRRSIIRYIETEIKKSKTFGTEYILIMFDLDKFKGINDTYGHQFGDEVLKKVSVEVLKGIKTTDKFGRIGGEEFLILLPDTGMKNGLKIAERIRENIERLNWAYETRVTVSLGVVSSRKDEELKELLERVDKLLYKAKEGGRNRIEY